MLNDMSLNGGETAPGVGASFTCKGEVTSALINGEADITVSKDTVAITSVMDATRLSWADVVQLQFGDYTVYIRTKTLTYVITKTGLDYEPLYNHLLSAYGDKVRKCLFTKGDATVKAKGDVRISDMSAQAVQGVPVEVYDDSIISLPPDLSARRTPLRFVNGFSEKDFSISVSTIDGKETIYSKLGYEHAPALKAIQDNIRALRAKLTEQIMDIAPTARGEEASILAKIMPGGLAAPMGQIRSISPAFAAALEESIAKSRVADTYKIFKEISGADNVCVGFKPDWGFDETEDNENADTGESVSESDPSANNGAEGAEGDEEQKPDYMLWLAVPSPAGNSCAIEFAGEKGDSAATFVYRFEGSWDAFRIKLGMALEAIDWKREVIRLTDEELLKPENELYLMANDRNEALRFIRSSFAGRGIHRSLESWKLQVSELMGL